jgi:predicted KAP-like P-loop ATPase
MPATQARRTTEKDEMGKPALVAIGSRWLSSKNGKPVILVVTERKPFGILEYQVEGKWIFGRSRQSDFLNNFKPAE